MKMVTNAGHIKLIAAFLILARPIANSYRREIFIVKHFGTGMMKPHGFQREMGHDVTIVGDPPTDTGTSAIKIVKGLVPYPWLPKRVHSFHLLS